eukprot:366414-Chlamydomonas_euryale.AAC.3
MPCPAKVGSRTRQSASGGRRRSVRDCSDEVRMRSVHHVCSPGNRKSFDLQEWACLSHISAGMAGVKDPSAYVLALTVCGAWF